jgi:hypothetical protein
VQIVKYDDLEWEDRINVDNWPSKAGTYYDDRQSELCIRLIDYAFGAVEPRHVHAGCHATTLLKNHAIVDGLTLGPLDVVLGPSNEPHGPLEYPEGCNLLSAFVGSFFHSEVEKLSGEKQYRLIQHKTIPWEKGNGCEIKTLVDRGVGSLVVQAIRFPTDTCHLPDYLGALVVEGAATIAGKRLKAWDFFHTDEGAAPEEVRFDSETVLLTHTMRVK